MCKQREFFTGFSNTEEPSSSELQHPWETLTRLLDPVLWKYQAWSEPLCSKKLRSTFVYRFQTLILNCYFVWISCWLKYLVKDSACLTIKWWSNLWSLLSNWQRICIKPWPMLKIVKVINWCILIVVYFLSWCLVWKKRLFEFYFLSSM